MSDDKLQTAINRAAQAQHLLESPLLIEAWAMIDKELVDRWRRCPDAQERDRIWQATLIAIRVQELLKVFITNGRIAQGDLERLTKLAA